MELLWVAKEIIPEMKFKFLYIGKSQFNKMDNFKPVRDFMEVYYANATVQQGWDIKPRE